MLIFLIDEPLFGNYAAAERKLKKYVFYKQVYSYFPGFQIVNLGAILIN
jgi:hypothetical protein